MNKKKQHEHLNESVEEPRESRDENAAATPPVEIGGRDGPDPTRFGDWEKGGRCVDF